jgi:hypothetical protein
MLEPCGAAVAKMVDKAGQPVTNDAYLNLFFVVRSGADRFDAEAVRTGGTLADADLVANIDREHYGQGIRPDPEGRVRLPALIPGAMYRLSTRVDGKPIVRDFSVKSGETVDLGEILVDVRGG